VNDPDIIAFHRPVQLVEFKQEIRLANRDDRRKQFILPCSEGRV
jgi:hypothetical protein